MKKHTLTKEEKALNQAIDAGEYVSVHSAKENKKYQTAAVREGITHQTLTKSLIQKDV